MTSDGVDGAAAGPVASILDHDPELTSLVPPDDRQLARRALAGRTIDVAPGKHVPEVAEATALYVISGIVLRCTRLGRAVLPELLGPGEVIVVDGTIEGELPVGESFTAVERTRLLALTRTVSQAVGRWPELHFTLLRRANDQRQRAAILGTIVQLPNVELRLLAALWHLADSWGRVGRDGATVPFPLTHAMLGQFVAARRPTVSLALQKLDDARLVQRRADGCWLLLPGSREMLRTLLEAEPGREVPLAGRVTGDVGSRGRDARNRSAALRGESAALQAQAQQLGRPLEGRRAREGTQS